MDEPQHERRASELVSKLMPDIEIVASHEVSSQWREFERTSTTVLSAYVKPTVASYLNELRSGLREAGVDAPLYAMRSSGGVSSFERAVQTPITLLESGPVAGVTAAAELGRRLGVEDVLTLDIGGTTAKTSAVRRGRVAIETLHHVERTPTSAGYPIQAPVVEIVEIGAGGGSIAWVDDAGGLHVGPRSAGAEPGPACYGRGGDEPTLTDANLVVGRLDPGYFLGGTMPLDVDAALRSLARLGERLGVDAATGARGVLAFIVARCRTRSGSSRSGAVTTRGTSRSWRSAARGRCMRRCSPASWASPNRDPAGAGPLLRARDAARRPPRGRRSDTRGLRAGPQRVRADR